MATHFSILAWRIPWTEKPGGLESIRSQRYRHDGSNLAHMQSVSKLLAMQWIFHSVLDVGPYSEESYMALLFEFSSNQDWFLLCFFFFFFFRFRDKAEEGETN